MAVRVSESHTPATAGDIAYSAGLFLEANNDTLHSSAWIAQSSNRLVRHCFTSPELQPASQQSRGGSSFSSVGQRFSADLSSLLRTLSSTEVHFIRYAF